MGSMARIISQRFVVDDVVGGGGGFVFIDDDDWVLMYPIVCIYYVYDNNS